MILLTHTLIPRQISQGTLGTCGKPPAPEVFVTRHSLQQASRTQSAAADRDSFLPQPPRNCTSAAHKNSLHSCLGPLRPANPAGDLQAGSLKGTALGWHPDTLQEL